MAEKSGRVAPKTETRSGYGKVTHPYQKFENKQLWLVIDEAINDLVENRDITETTHRSYIVGYLCKKIDESIFRNSGS